jgi:hypothetical protein
MTPTIGFYRARVAFSFVQSILLLAGSGRMVRLSGNRVTTRRLVVKPLVHLI